MACAVQSRMKWGIAMAVLLLSNVLCARRSPGINGDIMDQTTKQRKDAIVEHVTIYPQEREGSPRKIARKGVLMWYPQAKATVLLCHGFMCDKYDIGMLRRLFKRGQFNVMTFDFRAHGENIKGQYCTFGHDESLDVIAATKFLHNHPQLKGKPVFAYGFSMGAVAAIEAQAKDPSLFQAMILDCPFDSSENIIKKGLDNLKISLFGQEFEIPGRHLLQKYAFHPYVQSLVKMALKTVAQMDTHDIQTNIHPLHPSESIKNIAVPCFFIHCKHDEKVSANAIKTVYNGAAGWKRLWLTNGRRHYDSFFYNPEKYIEEVRMFLNQVLTGELYAQEREKMVIDEDDELMLSL